MVLRYQLVFQSMKAGCDKATLRFGACHVKFAYSVSLDKIPFDKSLLQSHAYGGAFVGRHG
ncbi:hypothetical protein F4827_006623 [Paraburkholderia bannensis]|uniref:Uncharacterized protein n=1 Tax=Paraburkholderia bannensis TaxID=765414 RepID=A0A7W9U499_9BURK|nr:hypothetical protein [Paraburkholderia sp. WP4_3_2]MBB6106747.1 hypothetical protein [Paraburkholderia bannensis]